MSEEHEELKKEIHRFVSKLCSNYEFAYQTKLNKLANSLEKHLKEIKRNTKGN